MLSKLLKVGVLVTKLNLVPRVVKSSQPLSIQMVREFGSLIPPNQYDSVWSKKMKFFTVIRHNWEVIPLFLTTGFALGLMVSAIIWSIRNKVDVVYQTHSCNTISRTMDLRCPTVHKFMIINQRYNPWPKLQGSLDKMRAQEQELNTFLGKCKFK